MHREAIVHGAKYYTDENTQWFEVDIPLTTDILIMQPPDCDVFSAKIVGEPSEFVELYVFENDGCFWYHDNIMSNTSLSSFIEEAMSWYGHNIFLCDYSEDIYRALKLCYY